MRSKLTRRQALQLGGVATVVAVAGCLGDDDTTGDAPAYAGSVPAIDDEVVIIYIDIEGLDELEDEFDDEDDQLPGDDDEFDEEDPLLVLPLASAFVFLFVAGFAFMGTGLDGLLDEEQDDEMETSASEMYLANDALVVGGTIDTDEVHDALTDVPEDDFMAVQYEQVDETGGYAFYEPTDGGTERVLAVSDDKILLGDTRAEIDPVVETDAGDREPAVEEYDTFEWLLSTASEAHMAFAGYSPDGFDEDDPGEFDEDQLEEDEEFEEFEGANGIASSLTFGDSEIDATLAAEFDDLSDETRADIEELLDTETADLAEDYSVEFDGDRVTISATYAEDALDDV